MSIHHHIHAFDKTIAHLLDLDENIKDENKALLLLNFILDKYLATTLLYNKDKATFDVVCTTLLSFECKTKSQKSHTDMLAKTLTVRDQSQTHKHEKKRQVSM